MRKSKKNLVLMLFVLLLALSLGYALLTQDLTINGITKVKENTWDIHFDSVQISDGSVSLSEGDVEAAIDSEDDTLVEYTVTLNLPGDYYEFTVDAVNEGTVDGMIGEIITKLNGVAISNENPLPDYLTYTFSYSDDTPVANNHLLAAGTSETFKVRVEFKRDIENSELPTTDQTNSFSFGVSYVQSDSNAIVVTHPTVSTVYTINLPGNVVSIGQSIPNNITQYDNVADVIAALNTLAGGTVVTPIYLKHILSNNIVVESYVEFVITPELEIAYPAVTAGTHTLRGFPTYDELNGDCAAEYWDSTNNICLSPYYASNIDYLQNIFDISNCSQYNSFYSCTLGSGLGVSVYLDGPVYVADDSFDCHILDDGDSYCDGMPIIVNGN